MKDKNLYIFFGAPGSGKTELRKKKFPNPKVYLNDPDSVMTSMEAYQNSLKNDGFLPSIL